MHKEVFLKNRECFLLLPEVVGSFRKQMFFEGSKRMQTLIKNFGVISDYVVKSDMPDSEKQEWMLILQAFLEAQENKDYILMADILEGDVFVFLEKIQSKLTTEGQSEVSDYWEANIQSLKKVNPSLYKVILCDSEDEAKQSVHVRYEPFLALNGQPTLKVQIGEKLFCMHSTVNPDWEAKELARTWLTQEKPEYQIFGMGMGYHVKALLEEDKTIKVTVLEYRIEPLVLAFQYLDWTTYLTEGRLQIVYYNDLMQVLQKMKREDSDYVFYLHNPSLQCVEQQNIKELLEDYFINTNSMIEQGKSLHQNFKFLQEQKFPSCDQIGNLFEKKNVAIVAGGPSLDDEIAGIKKYREEMVVLSVGTSARKLINVGIRPDAIIITDPQDTMYRQVEGVDTEGIPLLLLSTASRTVVKYYRGPIYIVYQHGYEPAEKVASEHGYPLFQTGGSVTTTALDVSIGFGAEKIFLIGADMAYTDNRSHTNGVGHEEQDFSDFRQVVSVDGGLVYTTRNLDIYRKWIEKRIVDLSSPIVYNTSRGAKIAGTIEMKLEDYYGTY